ncbi:MAG: EpsG family protein [Clostridia bacterium]|nr:EpsG family protein [Clostridia bacterium]
MMAVAFIIWGMDVYSPRKIRIGNRTEERTTFARAAFFFVFVTFFAGLRGVIADTTTYIGMFKAWPDEIALLDIDAIEKDKGFTILSVIFKQFISKDPQAWLMAIAIITMLGIVIPIYKHSPAFGFSAFLFIATTDFTWLFNGMRQFIAVAVIFLAMDFIVDKKFIKYAIIVVLMSFIHGSAILMLPIYFIVQGKPWSTRMWISIIACVVGIFAFDSLMPTFGDMLSETQYDGYIDYMSEDGGGSIIRALVALVPVGFAFYKRKEIAIINDKRINLAINMSVFNFFCVLLASLSSGIFMGRLNIYFEVYNLILLPWIIKKVFHGQTRQMMTVACVGAYIIWFYYQMVLTWNYVYNSQILNTASWLN